MFFLRQTILKSYLIVEVYIALIYSSLFPIFSDLLKDSIVCMKICLNPSNCYYQLCKMEVINWETLNKQNESILFIESKKEFNIIYIAELICMQRSLKEALINVSKKVNNIS